MLASILVAAELDPSYLIGGDLNETGGGARHGEGDLFVFEADESDGSFLLGSPAIGVITNVDVDHVDFYPGGREEIEQCVRAIRGRLWSRRRLRRRCGNGARLSLPAVRATTYGLAPGADATVRVEHLGPDGARGVLMIDGREIPLALRIDGAHNLLDAAAAITTAQLVGVDPADAADAVATFDGVHRRFELRGRARGADFFDDYGQTPAEMEVTVATARRRAPAG
jgi:UDP-N-acetylmuramate--alanine ligase